MAKSIGFLWVKSTMKAGARHALTPSSNIEKVLSASNPKALVLPKNCNGNSKIWTDGPPTQHSQLVLGEAANNVVSPQVDLGTHFAYDSE